MLQYSSDKIKIQDLNLDGFFVGWKTQPSVETFQRILKESYEIVLAYEDTKLIGFINCISDGVLSAYIPLLEVLPEYQGAGIGKSLLQKMIKKLSHFYMVDLLCDENLIPFYEKLGMNKSHGVSIRNYARLS